MFNFGCSNVRGLNAPFKQKELRLWPRNNKLSMAGVLETRVKRCNFDMIARLVDKTWGFANNYDYFDGVRFGLFGIWIMLMCWSIRFPLKSFFVKVNVTSLGRYFW